MARRKQLKAVAGCIGQWCISRNFDYQGYSAIGQLYAYTQEIGINELVVNPIEKSMMPEFVNGRFSGIFDELTRLLHKILKANNIPKRWVQKIKLTLRFNQAYQHKYHNLGSVGQPFVCSVEITTDLDRKYTVENGCNVWVHSPKRESRRNGF